MKRIVGIDFGTTNSCVAVMEGGDAVVLPNSEGARTTPSMVGFADGDERFVGQQAKRQAIINPARTVFGAKRLIGRRADDPEVRRLAPLLPYAVVPHTNGDAWVQIDDQTFSPQEISALILAKLKAAAEDYFGEEVTQAVITVPAYFNDAQRQATRDAGRIAGLNVRRIINEPTAAALAYGFQRKEQGRVAVFDLGGGTFDISILDLRGGTFKVLATAGDNALGGEDFDRAILHFLIDEFQRQTGIDLSTEKMALQRLKEAAERAKHELSVAKETEISLPFLMTSKGAPVHFNRTMSRSELEAITEKLVERSLEPCKKALSDAGLSPAQITQVVLVGGMTRMPLVQKTVASFFGKAPSLKVNPDEVVAIGAAIQGGVLRGEVEEVLLLDVTPLSLGIETMGGIFTPLIQRNTPIPCHASEVFTTTLDFQDMVSVHVLQGERQLARDNHSLARFELFGIPPGPRGQPQIEVSFNIDVNGLVAVSAKELTTGKEQSIRVVASGGLNESMIQKMIAEADAQRESDRVRKERVELCNRVKGLIYTTEKSAREYAAYLKKGDHVMIEKAVMRAKDLVEFPDNAEIADLIESLTNLEEAAQRVAEAMYAEMMYNNDDKA